MLSRELKLLRLVLIHYAVHSLIHDPSAKLRVARRPLVGFSSRGQWPRDVC